MGFGRSNKQFAISVCISAILSFLYGVVTVQYRVFPFEQLVAIKQFVNPESIFSEVYIHRKSFFERHGRHQYDVVVIGDSITDGAEWEDLFPSLKIANRSIIGDTTSGVLKRMDSIYSTHARKALIMIGTNDFAAGADVSDVVENYRTIVNNLLAHGMKTYVQSTILSGKRKAEFNRKIIALNDQLKKMANENPQLFTYIDLNVGLAKDSVLNSDYSRDGVHLNGNGYAVWKDIIKKYIE